MIDVDAIARRLIAARAGAPTTLAEIAPDDFETVCAVQEATVAGLGGCGGWKVGAASPTAVPTFAPLPRSGLRTAGTTWTTRASWVAVEVEIAFRVARTIDAELADRLDDRAARDDAFDAVTIAIEIVESRLAERTFAAPQAKAADLWSHGGLIVGPPLSPRDVGADFAHARVGLVLEGREPIATTAGNPAGDPLRLLRPLALHCVARGLPLRAGQIVTTGSFTGMTEVVPPIGFEATIADLGAVRARIAGEPDRSTEA